MMKNLIVIKLKIIINLDFFLKKKVMLDNCMYLYISTVTFILVYTLFAGKATV